MKDLFYSIRSWAYHVFPNAGATIHLRKLRHEAREAEDKPDDLEEYADCLIALFAATAKAGFSYLALIKSARRKLSRVKGLKWQQQEDGTFQSIKP